MKRQTDESNSSTVALKNGLELVRLLSVEGPMTANELALRLSLRNDTAARLLKTLEIHGFVEQSRFADRFQPGRTASALSEKFLRETPVNEIARSVLQALADRHNATCILAVDDAGEALSLVVCNGLNRVSLPCCHVGSVYPLTRTAAGHALLFTTPNEADRLDKIKDHSAAETEALRESFCFFRASGCFRLTLEEDDVLFLAAPLHLNNAVLALEIILPAKARSACDSTRAMRDLLAAVEMVQHKCDAMGVRYLEDS
ncbi:helix-turn-helix domain-containing protein [Nitratireductor kimnyeongensis]|uniref:Helix-turn-helix domain-containing protein n=1 Tax=Nitratireductor kimnyeongensis TaxID=430679 RepID=A0ABW0TAA5_9HYPH|nr:helix-turn-helix domain-containing protein [Nitratireductor kimnyeongensis]QZZ36558.1 MarR family transcriptional regulator [Nitratireductor kimnyeongensis]